MPNYPVTYFRNFIFGVEDSLVSTVGLISGVAIAGVPKETIFLTGIVLIFVEAFSMSAGSFLSESSAEDYETRRDVKTRGPVRGSIIMFISYFVSGFIPLSPYFFFDTKFAFGLSILLSLFALFILGVVGANMSGIPWLKNAVKMSAIGGLAILVGVSLGRLLSFN